MTHSLTLDAFLTSSFLHSQHSECCEKADGSHDDHDDNAPSKASLAKCPGHREEGGAHHGVPNTNAGGRRYSCTNCHKKKKKKKKKLRTMRK